METVPLPAGFSSAGLHVGIKKNGVRDMALIVSECPAVAAGVFTTNRVQAAPVKLCKRHLQHPVARAIVMNSGIANACTGETGLRNAEQTAEKTAATLGCAPDEVLVCSTGSIGPQLPMDVLLTGVEALARELSPKNGALTAEAMMTTDTRPKQVSETFTIGRHRCRMTGFAKGAGMIEPNMATMLAYILTDAAVEPGWLQQALRAAVATSFNRISVDGDRSTNDSVLVLANGASENPPLTADAPDAAVFQQVLDRVCFALAMQIVQDGEGLTRTVTVRVNGARNEADADRAARAVANSMLNKTAWAGVKPNWGRVMDALGYSGAELHEERIAIDYDRTPAVRNGVAAGTDPADLIKVVSQPHFDIVIELGEGDGSAVVYTCNCTEEYVRINVV